MKYDTKGVVNFGCFGVLIALVAFLLLVAGREYALARAFLDHGFNPREEALTCLLIIGISIFTVGFLGGWLCYLGRKAMRVRAGRRLRAKIEAIRSNPEQVAEGYFFGLGPGGGRGSAVFLISGNDVVVTTPEGGFVAILKDGIQNGSVKAALEAAANTGDGKRSM